LKSGVRNSAVTAMMDAVTSAATPVLAPAWALTAVREKPPVTE